MSGLVKYIFEDDFIGLRVVCVVNMKFFKMCGVEFIVMVLCGMNVEGKIEFVVFFVGVVNGVCVFCEGFVGDVDSTFNFRKKIFEIVSIDFFVMFEGIVVYKGVLFVCVEGLCMLLMI